MINFQLFNIVCLHLFARSLSLYTHTRVAKTNQIQKKQAMMTLRGMAEQRFSNVFNSGWALGPNPEDRINRKPEDRIFDHSVIN